MYCVSITDANLDTLQWVSLIYYLRETHRENGLVADKTMPGSPSSIAAVGLALAAAPVVVEREIMTREVAAALVLKKLRFFRDSHQGPEPDATGYKGFYYHFLDMETGRRVWNCELSTIDTAFLIAGMLTAAAYFDGENDLENQIRRIADTLYRRVDWAWAADGQASITHGWRPETGFIPHRYEGYDEGLLLYILALGSPTHPIAPEGYDAWCSTFQWKTIYDTELLYSGPLFTHQLSHLFIDLKGIRDRFMRDRQIDYFENSRRATYLQREYAIRNPFQFASYSEVCWGFTAADGPRVDDPDHRRRRAGILRLHRPGGPVRAGRRDDLPLGGGCFLAVRARDRPPDDPALQHPRPGDDRLLRIQDQLQPDLRGRGVGPRLGLPLVLRDRPGSVDSDDRELSDRPPLVDHQALPIYRGGPPPRRVPGRLALVNSAIGDPLGFILERGSRDRCRPHPQAGR